MSGYVSDKLKALPLYGEPWTPADVINLIRAEQMDAVVKVLNAMPEIIEVIHAAEICGRPVPPIIAKALERLEGKLG